MARNRCLNLVAAVLLLSRLSSGFGRFLAFNTSTTMSSLVGVKAIALASVEINGSTPVLPGIVTTAAAVGSSDKRLAVFSADSGSTFRRTDVSPLEADATSVIVEDLDKDGLMDILAVLPANHSVVWFRNTNDSSLFEARIVANELEGASGVAVADFTGDGRYDVVTASQYSGQIAINVMNPVSRTFEMHGVAVVDGVISVASGDLDGDGVTDLVAGSQADGSVTALFMRPGYSSISLPVITSCNGPYGVAITDLNGDGLADVVATCATSGTIVWTRCLRRPGGDVGAVFDDHRVIASSRSFVRQLVVVDLDNDGDNDVVVVVSALNAIEWYDNDGTMAFTRRNIVSPGTINVPWSVAVVDMNGDGGMDVVVGSENDASVTLFTQVSPVTHTPTPTRSPPRSASPSPTPLPVGLSYSFSTSPWSSCVSVRGRSIQSREVRCVDNTGRVSGSVALCAALLNQTIPASLQDCVVEATLFWSLPADRWSACTFPCDDGTGATLGLTTRTAPVCYLGSTLMPPFANGSTLCDITPSVAAMKPVTQRACNRFPCPSKVYHWKIGAWGSCIADNTSTVAGSRLRTVTCVDGSGSSVSFGLCASSTPSVSERCVSTVRPSSIPTLCTPEALGGSPTSCGTNRKCAGGVCVCAPGWLSLDANQTTCTIPDLRVSSSLSNCSGLVDVAHTCCGGPIDSVTGVCCGSDSRFIDGNGRCCAAGNVDVCGVCGGSGVAVDAKGVCCTTALDTSGLCCPTSVDDCGTCGGVNACSVSITVPNLPRSGGFNVSKASIASAFGIPVSSVAGVQLGVTSTVAGARRLTDTETVRTRVLLCDYWIAFVTLHEWCTAGCGVCQNYLSVMLRPNATVGNGMISVGLADLGIVATAPVLERTSST